MTQENHYNKNTFCTVLKGFRKNPPTLVVWSVNCSTDEEAVDDSGGNIVFLKELATLRDDQIGRSFLTRYLTKVDERN